MNGYNILADIPGRDPKAGYVMAGAHLLSALHVKPKRAIRSALWSGEEQGLIGSSAYLARYLARRPVSTDPVLAKHPSFFWDTYPTFLYRDPKND